jgi:hypothetical protein
VLNIKTTLSEYALLNKNERMKYSKNLKQTIPDNERGFKITSKVIYRCLGKTKTGGITEKIVHKISVKSVVK